MISAHQMHRHAQNVMGQLYSTDSYEQIKQELFQWRDHKKSHLSAISTFLKILNIVSSQHPELLDDLNRCLYKEYSPTSSSPTLQRIKQLAAQHPHTPAILDSVLTWLKSDQAITSALKAPQLEELSELQFAKRLERHRLSKDIGKIINLYRRCVLTISEFKKLLEPIYLTDPSFFNMLFQYAQQSQTRRRKVTIFAPLNQLVDQKYPLEQVGNSYILIPDGYANWGSQWKSNFQQNILNRVFCSVPLGTEGSFTITRKNQYQQQLLRNEEEKYEIDSNIVCLKSAVKIIEKSKKLNHPLVIKIIANIYPSDVVAMMRSASSDVAKSIVLPRLNQKLAELTRCRSKFEKVCEQLSSKNFYKSLDYRCFYFCKNDKRFNCPARWEKEIELRKKQVIQEEINKDNELQIEDRESLQHSRHHNLNTFDNITTQQLVSISRLQFGERKASSQYYPPFPHNQVLFLVDFSDSEVLNDVLQIVLHYTQKKNILDLIVIKLFKTTIDKKLQKQSSTLQFVEGKLTEWTPSINQPLNDNKVNNKKCFKDLTEQFLQLIDQEHEAAHIEEQEFPFQGPQVHTFIGTKQIYFFVRYLLTIYQRFLRAKSLSQERINNLDEPSLYRQFLSVLSSKVKEQKTMEQNFRRIFQQDAYIFFTLDKLIMGLVKLISNISTDSLTFKILRDDVRDYELQIKKWQQYTQPSVTQQLTRLYREKETIFRFSFCSKTKLLFISAWQNGLTFDGDKKKKQLGQAIQRGIQIFISDPTLSKKQSSNKCFIHSQNQFVQDQSGNLIMRGYQQLIKKRKPSFSLLQYEKEFSRVKKLKLI